MGISARETFGITSIDGHEYCNPLGDERYLVRFYELPPKEDLDAYLKLLESFERRFFYTADHGTEALRHRGDIDDYVDTCRHALEKADETHIGQAAGRLSIALLERGINKAREHIALRISGTPESHPILAKLHKEIGEDLIEAGDHFQHVRRKRGHPDIDGVLNEMKGEPYNIYAGTLPNSDYIHLFHRNRFNKAAGAMKCMDNVIDTILPVAKSHPQFISAGIPELLQELNKYAKIRVQLERADPDFKPIDDKLTDIRNKLLSFELPREKTPAHLPADHSAAKFPASMSTGLIQEAVDMIYDMSIIRGERKTSARLLKEKVSEIQQVMGRSAGL
jgi:hypothetical protein